MRAGTLLCSALHVHTHRDKHLLYTYYTVRSNIHISRLLGVCNLIVFYSSHRVRSTFLSVIWVWVELNSLSSILSVYLSLCCLVYGSTVTVCIFVSSRVEYPILLCVIKGGVFRQQKGREIETKEILECEWLEC